MSLSASASTIAEGGAVTFTCTVTPSTSVSNVTFSYEDGSPSDVVASSPYQATHVFNTPMDALTTTASVTYLTDEPAQQATVDVDVVGLSLTGSSSPARGIMTAYTAQSNPAGKAISQFGWTYAAESVTNSLTDYDADGNDISTWLGRMVISGTLTVQATVSGVACSKQMSVTVQPRGWALAITCAQDNEPSWGDEPTEGTDLGGHRDRDSNALGVFFVPQVAGDFSSAVTLSRVGSGPCTDWWYVASSTLKCQRETVINKYIKAGGPAPAGASENFFDRNGMYCLEGTVGDFIQAVKNHEYRGTPDTVRSEEGHHGRTEGGVADSQIAGDPKRAIESLASRTRAGLEVQVNTTVGTIEMGLATYANDEDWAGAGPNWGEVGSLGVGLHAAWVPAYSSWTDCNSGPGRF